MKAISLLQPWATLMVIGAKRVETRSWNTKYRGPLLIHASMGLSKECRQLCQEDPFNQFITNVDDLPRGAIIGMANLKGTGPTERFKSLGTTELIHIPNIVQELAFGDYRPNRYGWYCEDAVQFKTPIPCKGALSLWDFPDDQLPAINDSKPDYSALSDRDLEGLICEQLFGWVEWQAPADGSGDPETRSIIIIESVPWLEQWFKNGYAFPPKGKLGRYLMCPSWCNRLESALELAGKVGLRLSTPLPRPRIIVEMALAHGLQHPEKIIR